MVNIKFWQLRILNIYPLPRREAPAEVRSPEGEGANIDRRLVPYHGKCRRIQSRIEFIYLYIYIYIYMYGTFDESNDKSTESSQTEINRIQSDEIKVEYSKALANETWAYKNQSDDS